MVELRPMTVDDVAVLRVWDDDADVAAALGGAAIEWYDWPNELERDVPWRELLIAVEDGRPIGFLQLADAAEEESHYWGDVPAGTWSLDIWIGSPGDRGRGLGKEVMQVALHRMFEDHDAEVVVIDPLVDNRRAIAFYERIGFERVDVRELDGERCLVMRMSRAPASRPGR